MALWILAISAVLFLIAFIGFKNQFGNIQFRDFFTN